MLGVYISDISHVEPLLNGHIWLDQIWKRKNAWAKISSCVYKCQTFHVHISESVVMWNKGLEQIGLLVFKIFSLMSFYEIFFPQHFIYTKFRAKVSLFANVITSIVIGDAHLISAIQFRLSPWFYAHEDFWKPYSGKYRHQTILKLGYNNDITTLN